MENIVLFSNENIVIFGGLVSSGGGVLTPGSNGFALLTSTTIPATAEIKSAKMSVSTNAVLFISTNLMFAFLEEDQQTCACSKRHNYDSNEQFYWKIRGF